MPVAEIVQKSRDQEKEVDILRARWYIVAASALAAASEGPETPNLYRLATQDLPLETEKLVQRRLKEAILKTGLLYGIPKCLQALMPLFDTLRDEQIDTYGPRLEAARSGVGAKEREERGKEYFDIIWTPQAAQANREKNLKYHPDLSLTQQLLYEWWISEDAILSRVETQMCMAAALICSNSPVQALWHTRGIVRHGGTIQDAQFAQDIGLAIASAYDCKTGEITPVAEIDFADSTPQ